MTTKGVINEGEDATLSSGEEKLFQPVESSFFSVLGGRVRPRVLRMVAEPVFQNKYSPDLLW